MESYNDGNTKGGLCAYVEVVLLTDLHWGGGGGGGGRCKFVKQTNLTFSDLRCSNTERSQSRDSPQVVRELRIGWLE